MLFCDIANVNISVAKIIFGFIPGPFIIKFFLVQIIGVPIVYFVASIMPFIKSHAKLIAVLDIILIITIDILYFSQCGTSFS
jgi:hypothetical protein